MTLKERIQDDMKAAMRAKDSARLGAIRLLLAAIKQREVDDRVTLDDTGVIAVVDKLLKQRRDSIAAYEQAGRQDLAERERAEARCCRPTCRRAWTRRRWRRRWRASSRTWVRSWVAP